MRRRDEQGAVAALVALMLVVVTTMAAFAVDLGMQRVVRSDMQTLSDVVALDTARLLDGRTAAQVRAGDDDHPSLEAAKQASVERNDDSNLGSIDEVDVRLVFVETGPNGSMVPRRATSGALVPVADNQVPDGVFVTSGGSVNFAFRPGSGSATRSALAQADSNACFKLGSYAAAVRTGDSALLSPLLGQALDLTAVGYDGLANLDVSLLDIATELNVGTVQELLTIPNLSLGQLLRATASALPDDHGDEVGLLTSWAGTSLGLTPIQVGQILHLDPDADAALTTSVNVLDLVAGAVFVADGETAVHVQDLSLPLGPLADVAGDLKLVQRPQIACGREGAQAQTAQVQLRLDATLLAGVANISIDLDLAKAVGTLGTVDCGNASTPGSMNVSVSSALVSPTINLTLLGFSGMGIGVKWLPTQSPSPTSQIALPFPRSYDTPVQSEDRALIWGRPHFVLPDWLVWPLKPTVEGVLDATVAPALDVVLTALQDLVVDGPLERLLGLRIAGSDVWALRSPSCASPVLRG